MRSLTRPEVNIRMLVLDICEVTGLKEDEVISSLCDRFEDNFINQRNREPIYLINNGYRLPHTYALVFLWSILDKQFKWDDVIDKVLGVDNKWIERSIPFEQFNLSCQDLLLLFPKNILDMEKLGLLEKWQYGVEFDGSRIITTHASTKITRQNIKVRQGKRTRADTLKRAMVDALNKFRKKGVTPSTDDMWNYLIEYASGTVVDHTDEKLIWVDAKGNFHDIRRKSFSNRLSRIKSSLLFPSN